MTTIGSYRRHNRNRGRRRYPSYCWLIRRHFRRDQASQQTGSSEAVQTRPVQHSRIGFQPHTLRQKDHADYEQLLQNYEMSLNLLEDLIITRSQVEAGSDNWNEVLDQQFARSRDQVYKNLEEPMGVFQSLDILEGRNVGLPTDKRAELQARQAEIENHRLFIKRGSSGVYSALQ